MVVEKVELSVATRAEKMVGKTAALMDEKKVVATVVSKAWKWAVEMAAAWEARKVAKRAAVTA